MKPLNYFPSLERRSKAAISTTADANHLDALIAESELALAEAPPEYEERLRATLVKLKAAHAHSRSHLAQVVR